MGRQEEQGGQEGWAENPCQATPPTSLDDFPAASQELSGSGLESGWGQVAAAMEGAGPGGCRYWAGWLVLQVTLHPLELGLRPEVS